MCHAVVVEVGAGREPFPAHLTLMWFLARVDPTVCVEGAGRRESLATYVTSMRLLAYNRSETSYIIAIFFSPVHFEIRKFEFESKMEISVLNITYKDRRTNMWVRERKGHRHNNESGLGQINHLKHNRWTSRVNGVSTWKPYDKKK